MSSDALPLVQCVDVARTFGHGHAAVVAVYDVNCVVRAGEQIALVGPSGSGKSSLLHLMAALDTPTSGSISWPALGGRATLRPGPVGIVFQGPSLLAPLDVTENVALPLLLQGLDPDTAEASARAALMRLDLTELVDKLPEELSGGQSQRVAVARVLASSPRLILADEPTGQLDHAAGAHVIDVLLAAARETGAALIVSTHDPAIVKRLALRWEMADGRLLGSDHADSGVLGLTWLRGLVARRTGRLTATAAGVAIAVALLASIGTFLASSKATMTRRAAATVGVDWQVETQSGANPAAVLSATRSRPAVKAALPVGYADSNGFTATTGGTSQSTGPGKVLGIPPNYRATFPAELRDLAGSGSGVLLAQQTAANLHAAPGDIVTIDRAGLPPVDVRVDGVIDLPQANSLFQKIGAPLGAQPQAPPDNVIIVPSSQWHELFDPLAQSRPDLVSTQIHTQLSHRLPGDPSAAYTHVSSAARNLEARLAGSGLVGDNLGATLSAARADALYAQILFLFLGVPGALLAGLLTVAVAHSGAERRRREQALLRTRGASTRQLARLGLLEAVLIGGVGAFAGLGIALVVGQVAFGTASFGAGSSQAIVWAAAAAAVGLGIAVLAIGVPTWRDARAVTVAAARRPVGRSERPRWMRYGVDAILLAGAVVVFWLTSRNGYQLVLAPEGTPAISVSYWALAGPALLWVGIGLLAYRIAFVVVARGRRGVARAARPFSGPLARTVAAGMSRQRRLLARGVALVALTLCFAGSTAVFNDTYRAQSAVDARLTNGADVTVTEPPGIQVGPGAARALARIAGVASVEPLQHRYAYVGADLQDLFGVRTNTIVNATKLQDAYFQGGTASELINRLAQRPDGVLVSAETVKDFQLRPGDLMRLRLQDATTRQFKEVPFHYVGVVSEFPTAPKDSFFVANADYITSHTGSDAVGAFLIDTAGSSPQAVARRVRAAVGVGPSVTDIATSRTVVGSSLTAVDLSGLTRVELAFALVLVAASSGLVLALGLAERRRTFAIAVALGARPRQLGGFVWSEAIFVTFGGLVIGAVAGWALAEMLVKVLTGVFDPPPSALAVPWIYLAALVTTAVAAVVVAAVGAIRSASRAPVSILREL